jgi:tetracycline resistance efflux pump
VGGNVSRTITDPHRISRAKLSYIVDSTAAPVIILVPISGWAAFIAATMTGILNENEITEYSGYEAFLWSVPTNYYAITAILFVFAVAYFGLNFGPMRKHERRAVEEGALFDASHGPSRVRLIGTCPRERMARSVTWFCRWRRSSVSPWSWRSGSGSLVLRER